MGLKKQDFSFSYRYGESGDFWFHVSDRSRDELTRRYMAPGMIGVTDVAYSQYTGMVSVRRVFISGNDTVPSDDRRLTKILSELSCSAEHRQGDVL